MITRRFPRLLVLGSGAIALTLAARAPTAADEITVPSGLERDRGADFVYRLDRPATLRGTLEITWTDTAGRTVERATVPANLRDSAEIAFPLDLRHAVAIENRVAARVVPDDGNAAAGSATATFYVPPARNPWSDYQIIMWQDELSQALDALRGIGITAGKIEAPATIAVLAAHDLGFYVENIATDFYSAYHRHFPDRPPNWRYVALKDRYRKARTDESVFIRDPSLTDPAWLARIEQRLGAAATAFDRYRPLFYNLADEPGIADLSVDWDFDFSPSSLQGMRLWLKEQYGSLAALNAEWSAQFATWEDVVPATTDQILARGGDDFAPWTDFRTWMDVAFARAVAAGSKAIHDVAPHARASLEGGQIPGEGGWDYARLGGAVDLMEIYDMADNIELVRSLDPATVLVTTSFASGLGEQHRIWRELLRGTRGLILWDDKYQFAAADGALGPRGRQAAPYFGEIRGGLGALLINSARHLDPVAILYSPASLHVQWLLDRRHDGTAWIERKASDEYGDNAIRVATRTSLRALEDMGLQPVFVSPAELEAGVLRTRGFRMLVLPQAIALAPEDAAAIRDFVARGGAVLAEGLSGLYDQHGRKMSVPLLADLIREHDEGAAISLAADAPQATAVRALTALLKRQGVAPDFPVHRPDGAAASDVETYEFRAGDATILALLRADASGRAVVGRDSETVVLPLRRRQYAYDLRARRSLGPSDRLTLTIPPFVPAIVALSDAPLPPPRLSGPSEAAAGALAQFAVRAATADDVVHVEVSDPTGRPVPAYSANLRAADGSVSFDLPFADSDAAGDWTITATDLASGMSATARVGLRDR